MAGLAGIGIDWYIRLEQGRTVSPSAATIDPLAAALRLDTTELAHLRALTRETDRRLFGPESVSPTIRRLVEGLNLPAYVTGRRWDILAWNTAAAELFPALIRRSPDGRNVLIYMLTDADARRLFGASWSDEAKRMIALFRTTHDLWAGDPAFQSRLLELRAGHPDFTRWWDAHDVSNAGTGRKTLRHPTNGPTKYEYASFQANDDPTPRLVPHTPV